MKLTTDRSFFNRAILAFLLFSLNTQAATITVNAPNGAVDGTDGLCSISEAIQAANTDTAVNECVAGSGNDTIDLSNDITLTVAFENDATYGRTGTPAIDSAITLDGNGFTLQRDPALICTLNYSGTPDEFRIMRVNSTGNLSIRNITVSHGCADFLARSYGGGVFSEGVITAIQNVQYISNQAKTSGGAVYVTDGVVSLIEDSFFYANFSDEEFSEGGGGAAIFMVSSNLGTIRGSTFQENIAASDGGGGALFLLVDGFDLIENNTFSLNSTESGYGGAFWGGFDLGDENKINNNTFYENTSRIGDAIVGSNFNLTNNLFVGHNEDCRDFGDDILGSNNLSTNAASTCPGMLPLTLTAATVGPLMDNGGPTQTHALLAGSEALDVAVAGSSTDQRGFASEGTRDIGAYEYRPVEDCPIDLQSDGFTTTVSDADELIQAIECANFNGEANGGDTINLGNDITLTVAFDNDATYGRTGTPAIASAIILEGNGYTLQREPTLTCTLNNSGNLAEFRIMRVNSTGNLSIRNITVSHGCVDGSYSRGSGGGVYSEQGTITAIQNVQFLSNQSNSSGGAVFARDGEITLIENSFFYDNYSDGDFTDGESGGAIVVAGSNLGTIRNSTFQENKTSFYGGGGVMFLSVDGFDLIENNTFSLNANGGHYGGVMYMAIADLDDANLVNNNTFYENTSRTGGAILGNNFYLTNNLFVGHDEDCTHNGGIFGSNNLSTDASGGCPGMLPITLDAATVGPLLDNGGPTQTHALLAGSEALDVAVAGSSTDQRGYAAFGTRDIGAYEQRPIDLCPAELQTDGFTTTVTDAAELIQAIECANLNGEANGGDTINLGNDITLTEAYENDANFGRTGTPAISTAIILNGQGHTLARDSSLGCAFDGNSDATEFRLLTVLPDGDLAMNHIVIQGGCVDGNSGSSHEGGGVFSIGALSIQNSLINANHARASGGGVLAQFNSNTRIENSSLSNNSATQGGGLSVNEGFISVINNSTFSNNIASNGGGIHVEGFLTIISLINNTTFSGNTATNGNAIYNREGNINSMQNSLLHNDSVCWVDGTFNGSNNLADASSTGCPGVLSTPLTTATVGPLSDNGCTMPLADGSCLMTHALLAGSEALDVAVSGSTTDQRGFGTSDIRDIGAFEAQPPVVTAPPDITVEATGPLTSPALGVATVTDVDETGVLTATALQTSDFPLGVTVLTWTATDSYGFFATDTQVITIADTTAPVITLSGPNPQQQQIGDPYVEFGASAVDLVDDNVTLSAAIVIDATAVNVNVAGTYLVTYNVTDNQGNPAETVSREVQVNDYQPVAVNDTFIINEDTLLTADDVDGKATTDSNDNSVLVNDSDPNGDQLTVVHTGVSTMAGMGGSLNMSADGTFTYTPVPNAFGTDQLNFLITNGSYASLTKLIVVVNPVNDAPSFSLMGHVDVTGLVNFNDDFVEVPGFVENIVLGPNNENDQQVDSFIVNTMDAAEVINAVSIDDSGLLRVDINIGNYGDATVQVRLKDDGGTANGGDDTSSIESFVVIYDDLIFYDGFEVNTEPFDTD